MGFQKGHQYYPVTKKWQYQNKVCKECKKDYLPISGVQLYCRECAKKRKTIYDKIYNTKYYKKNCAKEAIRKHRWYIANWQRIKDHQRNYKKQRSATNKQINK